MIDFEKQLEFYIDMLTTRAMRFARSDFSNKETAKLGDLENRMKRELKRTYDKKVGG